MQDEAAIDRLHIVYNEYADALYSYGCKFTDDRELVKDCIHDVFVNLYEKKDIRAILNLRAYLLRSLKNKLIDELSKKRLISISEELPFTIPVESSVENAYLENEEHTNIKKMVNTALSLLTDRQREAVYLYYIEELDYNSICQLMNMNYQSVRNLIHRSMLRLREQFSNEELNLILLFCISVSYLCIGEKSADVHLFL